MQPNLAAFQPVFQKSAPAMPEAASADTATGGVIKDKMPQ